jgi:hypothetical protein
VPVLPQKPSKRYQEELKRYHQESKEANKDSKTTEVQVEQQVETKAV